MAYMDTIPCPPVLYLFLSKHMTNGCIKAMERKSGMARVMLVTKKQMALRFATVLLPVGRAAAPGFCHIQRMVNRYICRLRLG